MILSKHTKAIILVANKNELSFSPTDRDVVVYEIGIGKLNALLSISTLNEEIKDLGITPAIINVGTAGSTKYPIGHVLYPEYYAQGDTYTEEYFWENTLFLQGQGDLQSIDIRDFKFDHAVLTADRFIHIHADFYKDIASLDVAAFDMESYAIAFFCFSKNLPFYSIKIVSDNCDGTVKDWESILSSISKKLGDIVDGFLQDQIGIRVNNLIHGREI